MIYNTHSHLNDERFDEDREQVIENLKNSNVKKVLVLGYDKKSSLDAIKLADTYGFINCAIGFQPENIKDVTDKDLEEVFKNLNNPNVVAVGEIGLDYYWENSDEVKKHQKEIFIKQIEIANKYDLPICIHCRDAIKDTLDILKEHPVNKKGVMHCYSGSVESMHEFIKLGYYISIGGTVTFKNAVTIKEVAKIVPLNMLLVETDDPYLAPVPYRGKRNEPQYVNEVIKAIAEIKNISVEELMKVTYENAIRLFGK